MFTDIDVLPDYVGIHSEHWGYHRRLASRFPYAVYYRVAADVIRVHAVLDCRRNPDSIGDRLG